MIDFHIHSKYSDGTDSIIELHIKANQANLKGGKKPDISLGIGKENLNIPGEDISKWANLVDKI
jgi:PHP family Zn ribbon phosphoesterase